MIRLKKEAKKKLNEFIDVAANVLWVACAAISTLVCCITYIFRYYNRYISPGLITFSRICCVIMIICLIPAVYLIVKNIIKNIIDSFEVVPRKTKKEKILESDKILTRDEKYMLQDITIQEDITTQELLDYYKEWDLDFYKFLIFVCDSYSIDKETPVKDVIDKLLTYYREYVNSYIYNPLFRYTQYERDWLEFKILNNLVMLAKIDIESN